MEVNGVEWSEAAQRQCSITLVDTVFLVASMYNQYVQAHEDTHIEFETRSHEPPKTGQPNTQCFLRP